MARIACPQCGKKFRGERGVKVHVALKHKALKDKVLPTIAEIREQRFRAEERENQQFFHANEMERLLNIIWNNLDVNQKVQAINSLDLANED